MRGCRRGVQNREAWGISRRETSQPAGDVSFRLIQQAYLSAHIHYMGAPFQVKKKKKKNAKGANFSNLQITCGKHKSVCL